MRNESDPAKEIEEKVRRHEDEMMKERIIGMLDGIKSTLNTQGFVLGGIMGKLDRIAPSKEQADAKVDASASEENSNADWSLGYVWGVKSDDGSPLGRVRLPDIEGDALTWESETGWVPAKGADLTGVHIFKSMPDAVNELGKRDYLRWSPWNDQYLYRCMYRTSACSFLPGAGGLILIEPLIGRGYLEEIIKAFSDGKGANPGGAR